MNCSCEICFPAYFEMLIQTTPVELEPLFDSEPVFISLWLAGLWERSSETKKE